MRFDVLTLFPDMFEGVLAHSILKRAQAAGQLEVHLHDIRTYSTDKHHTVDDTPYGGGAGMVLKVDVLAAALDAIQAQPEVSQIPKECRRSILMCPQGTTFTQPLAQKAAEDYDQITLICGHYEGYDERIRSLVDSEVSIGNYVLTGGELPAMILIDAITRLKPEVLAEGSPEEESFSIFDENGTPLVEYPHYTRPLEFRGEKVPDVLTSGHHAEIKKWRLEQAKLRTTKLNESPLSHI